MTSPASLRLHRRSSAAPGRVVSAVAVGVLLALGGCANPFSRESLDGFSLTYKINIQQGVVVTQEMSDQLKLGMSREQVRFVLGTPILMDPFHADRWDYPFRFQPGRGRIEQRRFAVYFDQDKLVRWNGDSLPTEEEFAASRNFATTKIVRAAPVPVANQRPQLPGTSTPDISNTSVTPGSVSTPLRPRSPTDSTPDPAPPSVTDSAPQ